MDDLIFDWEHDLPLVLDNSIELPQHNLIESRLGHCHEVYSTGNFTCVQVIFRLKRRLGYYLFHTYIPTCLIVIMSWISFWIKPEAVPARVTLCVTSLLTLSTQHAQSQKSLPPVSYIKAIDIFMSSCTVFVFASLMEYALVNILMAADERNNHQLNHLLQLNYLNQANTSSATSAANATATHHNPCLSRSTSMLLNARRFTSSHQNLQLAELAAMQATDANDPHNYNGNYYSGRHALYTCACPISVNATIESVSRSRGSGTSARSRLPPRSTMCDCSHVTVGDLSTSIDHDAQAVANDESSPRSTNEQVAADPPINLHCQSTAPNHAFCAAHPNRTNVATPSSSASICPCRERILSNNNSSSNNNNNNNNTSDSFARCRTCCSSKHSRSTNSSVNPGHNRSGATTTTAHRTASQRKSHRLHSSIRKKNADLVQYMSRSGSSSALHSHVILRRRDRAILIDKVSRWTFPLSFIVLNLVYWTVYLRD